MSRKLRWTDGDTSECKRYILIRHLVRHGPTSTAEWQICRSQNSKGYGLPYKSFSVMNTKREAKQEAQRDADLRDHEIHAVRWARRELKRLYTLDYIKWHGTRDAEFTFCGRSIPLALEGTFLPETDDDLSIIDCKHCMNHLRENSK